MRTIIIGSSIAVAIAVAAALALPSVSTLSTAESFRAVGGVIFVLVLPGFVWSFVAGSRLHDQSDWVARLIVSIGLSSALVPLVLFFGTRVGLLINIKNIIIEIGLLITLGLAIVMIMRGRSQRK